MDEIVSKQLASIQEWCQQELGAVIVQAIVEARKAIVEQAQVADPHIQSHKELQASIETVRTLVREHADRWVDMMTRMGEWQEAIDDRIAKLEATT
tara:strand:- start:261 stop:548 length:288 start_codon:yes stop_codon:yes gene_type:complete